MKAENEILEKKHLNKIKFANSIINVSFKNILGRAVFRLNGKDSVYIEFLRFFTEKFLFELMKISE